MAFALGLGAPQGFGFGAPQGFALAPAPLGFALAPHGFALGAGAPQGMGFHLVPRQQAKPKPKVRYTGAGVLVVDAKAQQVILVEDHTGEFRDMGGRRSRGTRCAETASAELYQETRMTMNVDAKTLRSSCKYVDIDAGPGKLYRCFIYYSSNVSCSAFYKAYDKVDVKQLPKELRETTRMTRFPLSGIKRNPTSRTQTTDQGRTVPLGGRVRKVLEKAIAKKLI